MEEEHLNTRLIKLRKSLNMKQGQFASHIGISQGALSLLENQKTKLSLESLENIIERTKVSPSWLLSGEGAMFKSKNSNNRKGITISKDHLIPLISIEAQAGYLEGKYNNQEYQDTIDFYKVPGFLNNEFRMFQIEGESMKHVLYPEDIVITEKDNMNAPEDGQLYIVIAKDKIVAKRVFYEQKEGHLILSSENPDFSPYTMKKKEVTEIWVIRGKITRQLTGIESLYKDRITLLEESVENLKSQIERLQKNM